MAKRTVTVKFTKPDPIKVVTLRQLRKKKNKTDKQQPKHTRLFHTILMDQQVDKSWKKEVEIKNVDATKHGLVFQIVAQDVNGDTVASITVPVRGENWP